MFYIIHLTDIHFGSSNNHASSRLHLVAKAIASRTDKNSDILIALTGDIAQSGLAEQYREASQFILALKETLDQRGCRVNIAIAPGNHDCNHKNEAANRTDLADVHTLPVSLDNLNILAQPQDEFRQFAQSLSFGKDHHAALVEYSFAMRDGQTVVVQAINTALYSKRDQPPGKLLIPTTPYVNEVPDADLHVSLMHHPTGWLDASQASAVRQTLSSSTDIVLTGHEHVGFAHETTNLDTDSNQIHVEGVALQGDLPDDSGFYVLAVDTNARKYSTHRFAWRGERYEIVAESELKPFQCNRRRTRGYSLTKTHHNLLNDLGIALTKPDGELLLSLDDVFVYPDLQDPSTERNGGLRTIRGEELVELIQANYFTVVTGPERGGKTCLAKKLIRDLLTKQLLPVYVEEISKKNPLDRRELSKRFEQQYSFPDAEAFLQLPSSKRVIVLDDSFLREPMSLEIALRSLVSIADHVVLFTSDAFHQITTTIATGSQFASARVFRLLPFGHARRGQLVDKWLGLLAETTTTTVAAYERDHLQRMQFLTNVVGRNLVPAFPVVLLSLLRANDQSQQPDLTRSGFSYYYDFLIRQQLLLGQDKSRDLDLKMSFLSELALVLLRTRQQEISETSLRAFTAQFETDKILELDYGKVVAALERSKLLVRASGGYRFGYEWARYYFVARQISTMLGLDASVETAKSIIFDLQKSIDVEESGNILLFLAYFSKHQFLFDSLVQQADAMFSGESELGVGYDRSLSDDLEVDEALKLLAPEYREVADPKVAREEWLAQRDQFEVGRRRDLEIEFEKVNRIVAEFFASVRVVQLLGQLLKNSPASIPGDQKLMVAKSAFRLSFRGLGFHAKLMKDNQKTLVAAFVAPLVSDGHVAGVAKLEQEARKSLHVVRYLATQATVRRVASALSDVALVPLADRLAKDMKSPASELVAMAVRLGLLEADFPEGPVRKTYEELSDNPMAKSILRRLVATRLYLYDTGHMDRQRICSHLEINVRALPQPKRKA